MGPLFSTWQGQGLAEFFFSFERKEQELRIAITDRSQIITVNNGELVHRALTELFVKRDVSAIERYWGSPYLQHNPGIPDGHENLAGIVKSLGPNFKYEIGKIVADGEWVMVHGRYTGWGPKPMVGVDIFRVKDGKLVEHWDVLQEEVPASATKSGRPMFTGTK